jgi:hypothetical protein
MMMVNKVSRIIICGIPYTIVLEKDNFDVDLHFGQIDYKTCTIRINNDISEALQIEALCHEMIHAILVHIGKGGMSQDEEFVQSLANAINQSFVPKIMEGDSDGE